MQRWFSKDHVIIQSEGTYTDLDMMGEMGKTKARVYTNSEILDFQRIKVITILSLLRLCRASLLVVRRVVLIMCASVVCWCGAARRLARVFATWPRRASRLVFSRLDWCFVVAVHMCACACVVVINAGAEKSCIQRR